VQSNPKGFDVFSKVAGAEWDTLFFFYGVILAVGGLGFMGYLGMASEVMYGQLALQRPMATSYVNCWCWW